ncbi:hypothetical protein [Mesorhizobium sp.]|uniref:hypothetical protein n=1 Tax=Mesorhizobium sp. TaxID=1871066 RepID=UPI000FE6E9D7|nr:hypothetical protein [Mesorhizobium sp.]RWK64308.1 MAG: hypothetical protein EOR49_06455 [Mesorhizobium sp.]RWM52072.1 MAG: hypothetical protein EOR76_04250 [Mesorhizobium sp.]RWM55287.1 MAG: hypothetical protein EOR78_15245 [Mesorhizobium sp.]RWM55949.1 MAG: hypothetical protein EOR79_19850 [Mesorhizobium sp.]RWN03988.1 MAG: hypothetical protein EOR85_08500 [Mesorhizobium sp.]
MIEYLAPSFIYTLAKDIYSKFRGRKRRLTPVETIALRQKWKPEFENRIALLRKQKFGRDAIIRDVARLDQYPNVKAHKSISPWFKIGLMATYEHGILAGKLWGTLTEDAETGEWRFTDYKAGERGDITVIMIGKVPYENIEAVDWDGDKYYSEPQIYCHFSNKGRPDEASGIYLEKEMIGGDFVYYTEIAPFDKILKLSRKRGIQYFG